jgi:formylglycine-generating enzyme required for sulfatase activity/serine/threonine protein kinase
MQSATTRARHRLALPLGYQLGSYEFQEQLGFGSFGITYLAYDHMLSRRVAIKELLPTMIVTRLDTVRVEPHTAEDEEQWMWAQERFVEEAQAVAVCQHPNVLHVFEAFRANGTAYMVTKFEEGYTLTHWLKNLGRPPTESELRGVLDPLLSALDTVHARQFLHRDIKPDNIYMAEGNRPVLIDFGSARQDVTQRSVPMTAIVTEGYAPFEQYSETGHQGPWTDLYALAAVMYCAIVGQKPPTATERAASGEDDPCLCLASMYASEYSINLLSAIDAALRLNARSRPQSTDEWRHILSGSSAARPPGTRTPSGFPTGRSGKGRPGSGDSAAGGSQGAYSYLPATGGGAAPAAPPVAPPARTKGRLLPWLVVIVMLLGAIGAWAVYQTKMANDREAARKAAETEAAKQARSEKDAADIRAQAEAAARAKQIAEEELQKQKDENDALKRKLNATPAPTPPPAVPVVFTPPPTPAPPPADPTTLASEAQPYVNSLGMEFVPAGTPGVLFCRKDTTRGLWRRYLSSSGTKPNPGMYVLTFDGQGYTWIWDPKASWEKPGFSQFEDHPVVGVNWTEARAFCQWLSRQENRTYRLPTDEEWSKAAVPKVSELSSRVGGDDYPWGSSWPPPGDAGNYAGQEIHSGMTQSASFIDGFSDGYPRTSPVGRFKANRYGLYDMGGNVWQWCEDEYRTYMNDSDALEEISALRHERADDGTPMRVLRGASWFSSRPMMLRTSFHLFDHPVSRYDYYGFRVVLEVSRR